MLFVRHAESTENAFNPDAFDSGDPDLSNKGLYQSGQLGSYLASLQTEISVVASSPARRALQTWDIASTVGGIVAPRLVSPQLVELDWGSLRGRSKKQFFDLSRDLQANEEGLGYRPVPDAETAEEAGLRTLEFLETYNDDVDVVVGHGFAINSLFGVVRGWSRQKTRTDGIRNGQVVEFDIYGSKDPVTLFTPCEYSVAA